MATLRTGMWVVDDENRVGVLYRIGPAAAQLERGIAPLGPDEGEVHYTDEHGDTIIVAPGVKLETLSQARWREIPARRRPERKSAALLGYA